MIKKIFKTTIKKFNRKFPNKPISAIASVILEKKSNKIILIKRANPPSKDEYSLPGGCLELGETLKEGILREIKEETNLERTNLLISEEPFHVYEYIQKNKEEKVEYHYLIMEYCCLIHDINCFIKNGDDASDLIIIDVENIDNYNINMNTKFIIRKCLYLLKNNLIKFIEC
jgi:8-oxo-dGTP diphosphatase